MSWRFWKRKNRKHSSQQGAPSSPICSRESPPFGPEGFGWPGVVCNAEEILGLQRLIGNQAVLELLAPERSQRDLTARSRKKVPDCRGAASRRPAMSIEV